MNQKLKLFSYPILLLITAAALANPLEITNIEVHRVGVNLPPVDEKYLMDNSDRLLLSGWEEAFYGELGWEVFCRLDTGAVDIVFAIDSTGSMGGTIAGVRANIAGFVAALNAAGFDYRLGAVTYGDGRCVWDFDAGTPGNQMTANSAAFIAKLNLVGANGGADGAEQSLSAIGDAIERYEWRPHALRIVIGFTDAPYCQRGDGCTGFCNPGAGRCPLPELRRDTEVAALLASTGTVLFWSSPASTYTGCGSWTTPVPWSPYGGTRHAGWYQHFAHSSGGRWYSLGTGWGSIFADVAALISEFMTVRVTVTNNTGSTMNPITANMIPGGCIDVLSANPLSFGPVAPGASHEFVWRIDFDATCSGAELCFNVNIAGGGHTANAIGCLYMEDCACAGPEPTVISPLPCGVWSACPFQPIVIEFVDDDVGTNPSTIQLEVNGIVYSYPTYMTWTNISTTVGRLTFTPPTPWPHGTCINYRVVRADDWNGCPLSREVACSFCMDLNPPELLSWTPTCGIFLEDTVLTLSANIRDPESGIYILGLSFTVNGTTFPLGAGPPTVNYTGSTASGTASISGTFRQLGLLDADSAVICLNTCDRVSPTYCGANCSTYCCVFYLNQPPEAEFVHPEPEVFTACDPEFISMHLWDDVGADVDPSTAVLNVNGTSYPASHAWMTVTTDSLHFTPPAGFFVDGDTIVACLTALADGAGASAVGLPICMTFYIDYTPPEPLSWAPECETFIYDTILDLSVVFEDLGSGIEEGAFTVTINGATYGMGAGPPSVSFSGTPALGTLSVLGTFRQLGVMYDDTIEVCIQTCDRVTPEYCGPNCETYCCKFPINLPPEAEFVYPEPEIFSSCEPQPFAIYMWDPAGAPVDPTSPIVNVNGIDYDHTSPMMSVTMDSIIFTPDPTLFFDGDTIEACLTFLADSAGAEMEGVPICLTYYLDYSPPASLGWDPECEVFLTDSFIDISIFIEDLGAGIDISSAIVHLGEHSYEPPHMTPRINYFGDEDSARVNIAGMISDFDPSDPDSFDICLDICDLVSPIYCDANCTTYCCRFYVNRPPEAEFVFPDDSTWTACDPQPFSFHIWDRFGPGIDPTTAVIEVNADTFPYEHPWVIVTSDSIFFLPDEGYFEDGDVVRICLVALADSAEASVVDLPICRTIFVDYTPPVVLNPYPPPDTTVYVLPLSITMDIFDSLSGLSHGDIDVTVQGIRVLWYGAYTEPDSLFHLGLPLEGVICAGYDELCTIEVCVSAPDIPDYCDANMLDTCWLWFFERSGPVPSIVFPLPNTISACEDSGIIIRIDSTLARVNSSSIVLSISRGGEPAEVYDETSPFLT
ncbi:MAG TPA: hypothetical protein ENN07_03140, partial [candidate division Zixibacteria bacterium]|nr:hypothetical protein [candidate division Zixibacteria bacterium]